MSKLPRSCRKILEAMNFNELYSAQQIHARMCATGVRAPGLSTTYRSLEILVREKCLQVIDFGDGERQYEKIRLGEHHHHLICRTCGTSIHMDDCLIENLDAKMAETYGFRVKQHILEIFGKCKACLDQD